MTEARQILPGSEHAAPRGVQASGRVVGSDLITVSVYLRPEQSEPVAADAAPVVHSRATLRHVRDDAQAANIAAVTAFAAEAGLNVIEADAARRRVQLRGTASALEAAFGTELHRYERDGATYRGRLGTLSVPADVADSILAVLGLDTSPVATPKFVPHRGSTPPRGFLPTEVA
ncbi:protease pro-enzyme activation domain-containing protein, partial [Sphingomonas bacterium]|uniref:protease pro-enzyme activation domain-containing protein n=1 Tax=Sphingomonas bacterium TaxID=1895847 RepID=UPI001C2DBA03